jgi:hypothetical protein
MVNRAVGRASVTYQNIRAGHLEVKTCEQFAVYYTFYIDLLIFRVARLTWLSSAQVSAAIAQKSRLRLTYIPSNRLTSTLIKYS